MLFKPPSNKQEEFSLKVSRFSSLNKQIYIDKRQTKEEKQDYGITIKTPLCRSNYYTNSHNSNDKVHHSNNRSVDPSEIRVGIEEMTYDQANHAYSCSANPIIAEEMGENTDSQIGNLEEDKNEIDDTRKNEHIFGKLNRDIPYHKDIMSILYKKKKKDTTGLNIGSVDTKDTKDSSYKSTVIDATNDHINIQTKKSNDESKKPDAICEELDNKNSNKHFLPVNETFVGNRDKNISRNGKGEQNKRKQLKNPHLQHSLEVIQEQETPFTQTPSTNVFKQSKSTETTNHKRFKINHIIKDSQIPYEYLQDIFINLKTEEKKMRKSMPQSQLFIGKEKQRAILVDWLLDVSTKFKLMEETFFLTIQIFDNYVASKGNVDSQKYQLIGTSSLSIACKYEEIYSPEIRDFVYIMNSHYTKEDILAIEADILFTLDFQVTFPSCLKLFEILSIYLNFNSKERNLGVYIMELFILDTRSTDYGSTTIAFATAAMIIKFHQNTDTQSFKFNSIHEIMRQGISNDEKNSVKECCRDIAFVFNSMRKIGLYSAINKFRKEKYESVGKINLMTGLDM